MASRKFERRRRPEVLADLDVEGEVRMIGRREDDVFAEADVFAAERDDVSRSIDRAGEVALLVILAIVRQEALRHDAQDVAAVNHDGAVEQCAARADRRADDEDREELLALGLEPRDRGFDAVEKRVLQQEIVDGVARQRELRR